MDKYLTTLREMRDEIDEYLQTPLQFAQVLLVIVSSNFVRFNLSAERNRLYTLRTVNLAGRRDAL